MTKILTDESIRHAYDRKVESCKSRNIVWSLPYDYYRMLLRSRPTMVCFYTGKQFDLRKTGIDAYPTLDRIDPALGYTVENTVLCHKLVNDIKNDYWETGFGMAKGMAENHIRIYRSIEKVMSQPELMQERMKPYQELQSKVETRIQADLDKQTRKQELSEACEKAKRVNEAKAKAEEQLTLSKHYTAISEEITKLTGMPYNLSVKVHRDVYRRGKDAITGEKFESMEDKFLWIPDKVKVIDRGWIEKGDFIVVHRNTQELLDKLSVCGNLKVSALNILKHV